MSVAVRDFFGNASSTHRHGQAARQQLENSRRSLAGFLCASPAEFVFTSGGTESNNLALFGTLRSSSRPRHAVTTTIEHPSVLECFRRLEREGVEVSYVAPDDKGLVDPKAIAAAIRPETVLLSVMHANNEVGTIQPLVEIAGIVRQLRAGGQQIYLHADGVQALGKVPIDLNQLGVDLYSISAHKVYAPKGTGGLYVRKGTPLASIQLGGKHERERRAGTENVPGAIAFARAISLCSAGDAVRLAALRDRFESQVLSAVDGAELNGARDRRLPNTSNILFHGVPAEALVIALDMHGMAVSTGSACSSGSIEPSPVLLAMGRSQAEARSSVRFSFGRDNTVEEIDKLVESVVTSVHHLRGGLRRKLTPPEVQLV